MTTKSQATKLWLTNRHVEGVGRKSEDGVKAKVPKYRPSRGKPECVGREALEALNAIWQNYAISLQLHKGRLGAETQALGRMELVGAMVEIVESRNPSHLMKKGYVLDETESMIYIQCTDVPVNRVLAFLKADVHFAVSMPGGHRIAVIGSGIDRPVATRTKAKPRKLYSITN